MARPRTLKPALSPANPAKRRGFDLATRFAADTVDVTICDPRQITAKVDTGIRITIESLYSAAAMKVAVEMRDRLKLVDGKVDEAALAAADGDWTAALVEQTIAVTKAWRDLDGLPHTILLDDVELECTPANVRRVYTDPKTRWVQKQVQEAYLNIALFFGESRSN